MTSTRAWLGAAAAGAALAWAVDTATTHALPRRRRALAAGGLVTAAAIYPVASRTGAERHEVVTLAVASAVAVASQRVERTAGDRLLAVAWASHAAFDLAFAPEPRASRLPRWYAPVCLGYDLVQAALLLRRPSVA